MQWIGGHCCTDREVDSRPQNSSVQSDSGSWTVVRWPRVENRENWTDHECSTGQCECRSVGRLEIIVAGNPTQYTWDKCVITPFGPTLTEIDEGVLLRKCCSAMKNISLMSASHSEEGIIFKVDMMSSLFSPFFEFNSSLEQKEEEEQLWKQGGSADLLEIDNHNQWKKENHKWIGVGKVGVQKC